MTTLVRALFRVVFAWCVLVLFSALARAESSARDFGTYGEWTVMQADDSCALLTSLIFKGQKSGVFLLMPVPKNNQVSIIIHMKKGTLVLGPQLLKQPSRISIGPYRTRIRLELHLSSDKEQLFGHFRNQLRDEFMQSFVTGSRMEIELPTGQPGQAGGASSLRGAGRSGKNGDSRAIC